MYSEKELFGEESDESFTSGSSSSDSEGHGTGPTVPEALTRAKRDLFQKKRREDMKSRMTSIRAQIFKTQNFSLQFDRQSQLFEIGLHKDPSESAKAYAHAFSPDHVIELNELLMVGCKRYSVLDKVIYVGTTPPGENSMCATVYLPSTSTTSLPPVLPGQTAWNDVRHISFD